MDVPQVVSVHAGDALCRIPAGGMASAHGHHQKVAMGNSSTICNIYINIAKGYPMAMMFFVT